MGAPGRKGQGEDFLALCTMATTHKCSEDFLLLFGERKVLNCGVQDSEGMVPKHGAVSPSSVSQKG